MFKVGQQRAGFDLDGEFLPQFPPETFLESFVRLALAAGKLPQVGEMSGRRTLGDEQPAFVEDQPGGNFNSVDCHGGCSAYLPMDL